MVGYQICKPIEKSTDIFLRNEGKQKHTTAKHTLAEPAREIHQKPNKAHSISINKA
jgi:hypothetical protein